jgi:methyl-accepting chemotaxis protein
MLEKTSVFNAAVTEETEAAAYDIMTQLRAIDGSVFDLLGYMEKTHNSVAAVVEQTEQGIEDNRRVIAEFLKQHEGDIAASKSRLARIEGMATSLASATNGIRTIASQSNMLALNAMIEAARAGRSGAGFTVVANEVKMLAKMSDQAAQEINAGIETLRAAIREGLVVEMEKRVKSEQEELGKLSTSIGALTRQTEKLIAHQFDILGRIQAESKTIGDSVARLSGSIQFQDVTRQKLEHLSNISDIAHDHLSRVAETISSGFARMLPSTELLVSAIDKEAVSLPGDQLHGAMIELF